MGQGMVVVLVVELSDLGTIEAVEPIGRCDPEKSLVILRYVGDGIAAETFGGGQFFDKMGNLLRDKKAGEEL